MLVSKEQGTFEVGGEKKHGYLVIHTTTDGNGKKHQTVSVEPTKPVNVDCVVETISLK